MAAVFTNILKAVQEAVKSLSLEDVLDPNVVCLKAPIDRKSNFPGMPGVIIAPFGAPRISPREGTNERDDVQYPVVCVTLAASNQDQSTNLDRHMQWHESIRKRFIHQRLSNVTGVSVATAALLTTMCYTFVDPRDTFQTGAFLKGYDAGGFVMRFVSRETRG